MDFQESISQFWVQSFEIFVWIINDQWIYRYTSCHNIRISTQLNEYRMKDSSIASPRVRFSDAPIKKKIMIINYFIDNRNSTYDNSNLHFVSKHEFDNGLYKSEWK